MYNAFDQFRVEEAVDQEELRIRSQTFDNMRLLRYGIETLNDFYQYVTRFGHGDKDRPERYVQVSKHMWLVWRVIKKMSAVDELLVYKHRNKRLPGGWVLAGIKDMLRITGKSGKRLKLSEQSAYRELKKFEAVGIIEIKYVALKDARGEYVGTERYIRLNPWVERDIVTTKLDHSAAFTPEEKVNVTAVKAEAKPRAPRKSKTTKAGKPTSFRSEYLPSEDEFEAQAEAPKEAVSEAVSAAEPGSNGVIEVVDCLVLNYRTASGASPSPLSDDAALLSRGVDSVSGEQGNNSPSAGARPGVQLSSPEAGSGHDAKAGDPVTLRVSQETKAVIAILKDQFGPEHALTDVEIKMLSSWTSPNCPTRLTAAVAQEWCDAVNNSSLMSDQPSVRRNLPLFVRTWPQHYNAVFTLRHERELTEVYGFFERNKNAVRDFKYQVSALVEELQEWMEEDWMTTAFNTQRTVVEWFQAVARFYNPYAKILATHILGLDLKSVLQHEAPGLMEYTRKNAPVCLAILNAYPSLVSLVGLTQSDLCFIKVEARKSCAKQYKNALMFDAHACPEVDRWFGGQRVRFAECARA